MAHIDLDALRHNYQLACRCAPQSRSVAVIKADAYGHGALACARALETDVPAFAVACIEEALSLREGGIKAPIVLLEGIFSADELALVDQHRLWISVHSAWQVEALLAYSPRQPIPVWLKVDSGMHRLGFSPEEATSVWQRLVDAPQVTALHLMSHFATADAKDPSYFNRQMNTLKALAAKLKAPLCLANSPATLAWPAAHGDWNRPGVMLYGSDPLEVPNEITQQLRPVMTLRSEIIALRELAEGEQVAIAAAGRPRDPLKLP